MNVRTQTTLPNKAGSRISFSVNVRMCGQSLATSPASSCPFPDSEDHLRIPGPQTVEGAYV